MLTAYFDASGSGSSTDVLSVAGFIASDGKWAAFEEAWNRQLEAFQVTTLHMKDFTQSRREFAGWEKNEAKRRLFISELIYVIADHYRWSFGSTVLRDAYEQVDRRFVLSELVSQYAYAAGNCINKVKTWAKESGEDFQSIRFVFEDGDLGKGKMLDLARVAFGIRPILASKTSHPALQAADLLAYEQFNLCRKLGKRMESEDQISWGEIRAPFRFMSDFRGADKWSYTSEKDLQRGCMSAGLPEREYILSRQGTQRAD